MIFVSNKKVERERDYYYDEFMKQMIWEQELKFIH